MKIEIKTLDEICDLFDNGTLTLSNWSNYINVFEYIEYNEEIQFMLGYLAGEVDFYKRGGDNGKKQQKYKVPDNEKT